MIYMYVFVRWMLFCVCYVGAGYGEWSLYVRICRVASGSVMRVGYRIVVSIFNFETCRVVGFVYKEVFRNFVFGCIMVLIKKKKE